MYNKMYSRQILTQVVVFKLCTVFTFEIILTAYNVIFQNVP